MLIEDKKERVYKALDQLKKFVQEDNYTMYKFCIGDLFEELSLLKEEQINKAANK